MFLPEQKVRDATPMVRPLGRSASRFVRCLRGGISVAMVLSLPPFPARDYLLACTYAVVVFSILVQGLTVRRVLVHYGVGT